MLTGLQSDQECHVLWGLGVMPIFLHIHLATFLFFRVWLKHPFRFIIRSYHWAFTWARHSTSFICSPGNNFDFLLPLTDGEAEVTKMCYLPKVMSISTGTWAQVRLWTHFLVHPASLHVLLCVLRALSKWTCRSLFIWPHRVLVRYSGSSIPFRGWVAPRHVWS